MRCLSCTGLPVLSKRVFGWCSEAGVYPSPGHFSGQVSNTSSRSRDDQRYIVAACRFCNEVHNRTQFDVEGKTPAEIVELKREAVLARRADYKEFWEEEVARY